MKAKEHFKTRRIEKVKSKMHSLKIALIITVALFTFPSFAQDQIYTHKGETIKCNVKEIGEKMIKYNYEGEDLVNSISKNLVSEITFFNGRVQKVTNKVVINSENDWENVMITNIESEVEGLTRVGEIMEKANSGWSMTNQGKMEKKAMDKLKKAAAAKGCHIVLLLTITGKGGHYGVSGGTKASVTGVAYKY